MTTNLARPMALRVVVVDDHDAVRTGLAEMLGADSDIEVVGQAGSVAEAKEVISTLQPDVAVLDLNLRDGSGRELVVHFADVLPALNGIIHTDTLEQDEADSLLAAGAVAVVLKSLRGTDLLDAIRDVRDRLSGPVDEATLQQQRSESTP